MLTSLTELSTHKGASNSVVTADERRQVDVEQCLILHAHPAIDHVQIDLRWMAKDERGQRVVGSPPRESQRVETVADEVCRHARREGANVIATEHSCSTPCCQPQHVPGGGCCRIARHPVQE